MAKVFISAGHGGSDPGAVANGFQEKDLNLTISLACRDELERHGVTVCMARTVDEHNPFREDIDKCNAFAPDLALDIHNNAGGGDGAEVFYSVSGGTSKALAQNVLDEIVAIGQNSRGIKTKTNSKGKDWFGFIRETDAPAVLVECAFLDTKADLAIIDTEPEQKTMGVAIAKGVLKTLGIAWKEAEAPQADKPKVYNTIDELPGYAKSTIQKLIDKGWLSGYADGRLGLTEDMVRIFAIHDRAGLYDN